EGHVSYAAVPGQFVNVKLGAEEQTDPLLRIPLGVHKVKAGETSLMYKVVGRGTRLLSKKKAGEELDILGPLGNGFSVMPEEHVFIVAGGHGIAPLCFLAERLAKKKKIKVFAGASGKTHIVCSDGIKDMGAELFTATEDGSCGHKGYVTEVMEQHLEKDKKSGKNITIYACGPRPMLKEVARIAGKHGIAAQVSLDEYMACGTGVCRGCAVKTKDGYKMVCQDGPVFDAREIVW
ncbi:MAG: dihydroorotate dehydrogenase electron transfer subunit, partial [Candidatus Omnitrophica bacterium]|nr:dihydroorotate dehydrogenase electron transfer subunit [Candidatus Omnitrophota bacterium]